MLTKLTDEWNAAQIAASDKITPGDLWGLQEAVIFGKAVEPYALQRALGLAALRIARMEEARKAAAEPTYKHADGR